MACNTASTLALAELRARFSCLSSAPCRRSSRPARNRRTKRIAVLGTQATVSREYTRALIREFAAGCDVTLVGSSHLATFAEAELAGAPVPDAAIKAEIADCFVDADARRTDTVVLACTHYPLLTDRFKAVRPGRSTGSIRRRRSRAASPTSCARSPRGSPPAPPRIVFTSGRAPPPALAAALAEYGF